MFKILFKNGKHLDLNAHSFHFQDNAFVFYYHDVRGKNEINMYLPLTEVSAIFSEERRSHGNDFAVHLKEHDSINISAEGFIIEPIQAKFFNWKAGERKQIDDFYVAASEVLAIVPIELTL